LALSNGQTIAQGTPNCNDGASIRHFVGPHPLVDSFWKNLQGTKVPLWAEGEFHQQEFKYLGLTESSKPVHLVLFSTIWGDSCRATNRLLVFDQNHQFLGMYSHLNSILRLKSNHLVLESGTADFTSGPPNKIDMSIWESALSVKSAY